MKNSEQLRYHAQQIDNQFRSISGEQADDVAKLLNQAAEIAEAAQNCINQAGAEASWEAFKKALRDWR